jgi:uncharacterized membrane protein YccC
LEPEYGSSRRRAVHRTLGTMAGAIIAGALLATVHGTIAYDVALTVLLFATFLLIRRSYGYGMTFLTPIIILLISPHSASPWIDLAERLAYTLIGAGVAMAAGYLLWPHWEFVRMRERLQSALAANQALLEGVLSALGQQDPEPTAVAALRRQAEIAVTNADAGFQLMQAEPLDRALLGSSFAMLVHLHRLCRHSVALSLHIGSTRLPEAPLAELQRLASTALKDVRQAIGEDECAVPWPSLRDQFSELQVRLASEPAESSAVAELLGQLGNDVAGLITAATNHCGTLARSHSFSVAARS